MPSSPPTKRLRRSVLTLTALGALLLGTAAPALAQVNAAKYVALGDSMPSGPLIPTPTGPLGCGRSTHNYPHELARMLDAGSLRDVTCSGADTKDMTQPQETDLLGYKQTVPPQLDALSSGTTLVTLTIGGNDAGLVGVAEDCVRLDPFAATCKSEHIVDGVDTVAKRVDETEPKIAAVLDGIRDRAPNAKLVVTGYGLYIKPRGCWPLQPVLPADADWLQGLVDRLNGVVKRQAEAHGATYIDLVAPSSGHDACAAATSRWIEGYVPVAPAAPLHPNARGELNYARIISSALNAV